MATDSANTSVKVAEIFLTASAAFQKLGELTLQLNLTPPSTATSRWSEKEVDMLKTALQKFSDDLDTVAEVVKQKTNTQIRVDYKRKALEDETNPEGKNTSSAQAIKRKSYATPGAKRQAAAVSRMPQSNDDSHNNPGFSHFMNSFTS